MVKIVLIYPALTHEDYCLLLHALGYTMALREDLSDELEQIIKKLLDQARTFEVHGDEGEGAR